MPITTHATPHAAVEWVRMPSILIIDDEEPIAWALRRAFEREKYRVAVAATAEDGLAKAPQHPPDVVFLDVRLPGMDGLTALGELKKVAPDAAVVVITAHGNLNTAVKAVEGGAFDYLAKPFDLAQALDAAKRALDGRRGRLGPYAAALGRRSTHRPTRSSAAARRCRPCSSGSPWSPRPTRACSSPARAAPARNWSPAPSTRNSPRRDKPFLPVHVAALNPNLVESELFGHVEGRVHRGRPQPRAGPARPWPTAAPSSSTNSPTSRCRCRRSCCACWNGRRCMPVGGSESQPVNVRIVSATHADLSAAVARRAVPPRPVLPPQRLPDPPAAAARPRRRHPAAGRALPAQVRRAEPGRGAARGDARAS